MIHIVFVPMVYYCISWIYVIMECIWVLCCDMKLYLSIECTWVFVAHCSITQWPTLWRHTNISLFDHTDMKLPVGDQSIPLCLMMVKHVLYQSISVFVIISWCYCEDTKQIWTQNVVFNYNITTWLSVKVYVQTWNLDIWTKHLTITMLRVP